MNDFSEELVREYMGQLYYFSLKKTSDKYEAEDLTQEILCEILAALERGIVPSDARAWVWKIARNRYARWAEKKHKRLGDEDIDELREIMADDFSVEDSLIRTEERALLYRELNLLKWDFSSILAAYYFDNKSIAEIAKDTSLPPGTIKRKLYESRQQIKEGMKMSRTYGKRSFAPENVEFTQNWNPETGKDGGRLVERLIPQNILLEAYDNPCTVEDLSLALGVAVPYIEDEIGILEKYGLLFRDGKKVKTGIVILSKKMQEDFFALGAETADRLTPVIREALAEIEAKHLPLPEPFDDFKPCVVDYLASRPLDEYPCKIRMIRHFDGAEWAILGLEKCDKNAESLEVWGNDEFSQVILLGNRTADDLSSGLDIDPETVPTFENWEEYEKVMQNSLMDEIRAIMHDFAVARDVILNREIPDYLRDTALYTSNIDFRRLVMDRLIKSGDIVLHEDMNRSSMGVWNYKK